MLIPCTWQDVQETQACVVAARHVLLECLNSQNHIAHLDACITLHSHPAWSAVAHSKPGIAQVHNMPATIKQMQS
jgi:hypothetical protein